MVSEYMHAALSALLEDSSSSSTPFATVSTTAGAPLSVQPEATDSLAKAFMEIFSDHITMLGAWIALGVLIYLLTFAARQQSRALHLLMIGMIYPAVLGSIFFNVLPSVSVMAPSLQTVASLFVIASIVIHFLFDYVYVSGFFSRKRRYTASAFFVDMCVCLFMYVAASSINFESGAIDHAKIAGLFLTLYCLFVFWDVLLKESRTTFIGDILVSATFVCYLLAWQIGLSGVAASIALAMLILGAAIWAAYGAGDDPLGGNDDPGPK